VKYEVIKVADLQDAGKKIITTTRIRNDPYYYQSEAD
jgi:hypothetical protein